MSAAATRPRRALFCAPLPPEFDRESGSRRIYHLVTMLRSLGWTVAFVCENAPADSPHVRHLRQMGVATWVGFGEDTETLVRNGGFDVAFFAFWYLADRYADRVRRLSPSTRIVVETVDLHWLRTARRMLGRGPDGGGGALDASFGSDMVAEINVYARADGVLTVSEKEASLVNDVTGDPGLAHAVPDHDRVEPGTEGFSGRRGVVFVGNFRHPPNLDAVEYLCADILPLLPPGLLRRHPVRIVGNGPGARVHELAASVEGVEVVGWVPSVVPYLQASRATVVPLRYGAGTKRKLIQALLSGTPTVATGVGVEGIDVRDGEHVLVAGDAAAFAAALERLLTDRLLWRRLSKAGRSRMLDLHGRSDAVRARLAAALEVVLARPLPAAADGCRPGGSRPSQADAVREAVRSAVPPRSGVLVVSKGDPALVDLPGYRCGHFPQAADGRWAGYHPKDSEWAVEHLSELGDAGDYLLFPATAFWWLDHYDGFARHLGERFERVWSDDACVIYRRGGGGNGGSGPSLETRTPRRERAPSPNGGP